MGRDYEAEARSSGWIPEEEFKGDNPPKEFVDAKTFVERGEQFHGQLKGKLERVESQLGALQESNKQFREYHEKTLAREKERAAARIAELEAERAQAITEGDGTTFTKADQEIKRLEAEARVEIPQQELPPAARSWMAQNEWYNTDDILTNYADGVADKVINAGYQPGSQAYFDELTRRTKEAFPDKFTNTTRTQPSAVESGGKRVEENTNPRSYEALPAEDKAQCDRFVRDIPGFTKEKFLEQYDWE